MANLSPEQLDAVSQWAEQGATLNDIQQRLKTDFGMTLTYMEARLLMIDVGVRLKDKPREPDPVAAAPAPAPSQDVEPAAEDEPADYNTDPAAMGTGKVTVTVDEICIPGALVSGKATFSDGKTLSWYVDQMGRLGMKAPEPGYKPPPADVAAFQNELDRVLMQQGF